MFTEARKCTLYVDKFGPLVCGNTESAASATDRVFSRINKGLIRCVNVTLKPQVEVNGTEVSAS